MFLAENGIEMDPDDEAAYELVMAVASGSIDAVAEIASALASFATDLSD